MCVSNTPTTTHNKSVYNMNLCVVYVEHTHNTCVHNKTPCVVCVEHTVQICTTRLFVVCVEYTHNNTQYKCVQHVGLCCAWNTHTPTHKSIAHKTLNPQRIVFKVLRIQHIPRLRSVTDRQTRSESVQVINYRQGNTATHLKHYHMSQTPPHITNTTTHLKHHHTSQTLPHITNTTTHLKHHHTSQTLPHISNTTTRHKHHHTYQTPPHISNTNTHRKHQHTSQTPPHISNTTTRPKHCQ